MKKLASIAIIAAILLQCCGFCVYADGAREMISVSAKYAAVIELNSGRLICGKAENDTASMASTTKIMTALLLCELTELDREITVTAQMVNVEGSSMGLQAGDRVHYRDLLYGMLLASGNDAANAVAVSIAGNVEAFADIMNSRARQIGMVNTHFVTPSGLDDDEHYSTAYDMALLAREAIENKDFADACTAKSARLEYGNPPYKRTITNHNKLLKMYDGCIGIKTGFTKKSGRCLVSCAKRDNKTIIAVTLNAPDDWNDHKALLDYGFSQLETRELMPPDLSSVFVVGSNKKTVKPYVSHQTVSLLSEDFDHIKTEISLTDITVAPINKGDLLGNVKWTLNGAAIAESPIFAGEQAQVSADALNRNYLYWIKKFLSA